MIYTQIDQNFGKFVHQHFFQTYLITAVQDSILILIMILTDIDIDIVP